MSEFTHIIVRTTADEKEYLYRASDGIRIAGRQHATVVFGDNPTKSESRVFIAAEAARKWIRGYAGTDLGGDARIDERNGDPVGIVIPDGMGTEEFMGGARGPTVRKII